LRDEELENRIADATRRIGEANEAFAAKQAAEAEAKRQQDLPDAQRRPREEQPTVVALERRAEQAAAATAAADIQALTDPERFGPQAAEARRQQELADAALQTALQRRQEQESREAVEDEQTWARGGAEKIDVFGGGIPDFEDGGAATTGAVPFSSSSTLGDPKPPTPNPFFVPPPPAAGFEDPTPSPADFGGFGDLDPASAEFGSSSGFGDNPEPVVTPSLGGPEPAPPVPKRVKKKKVPTLPPMPRPAPVPLVDTRGASVSPTKTLGYPALPSNAFSDEELRAYQRYQARAASRRGRPAALGASSSLPVIEDTRAKIIRVLVRIPLFESIELIKLFNLERHRGSISSIADHVVDNNLVHGFANRMVDHKRISQEEMNELIR
jgi:hypothetical protein